MLDEFFFYAILKYGYMQSEPEKPLKIFCKNDLNEKFWMKPLNASLLISEHPQFLTSGIIGRFLCKREDNIQWITLDDYLIANSIEDIYKILLDKSNPYAKEYFKLLQNINQHPTTVPNDTMVLSEFV